MSMLKLLIASWCAVSLLLSGSLASAADVYAIDGDTIVIRAEHIRILNIDTPEIHHAGCDAELRLGLVAKARTEALIHSGQVDLQRGDHGRMKDKYGRTLALVFIDGVDLGETLIKEGLARRWDGRRHPWCD